MDFKIKKHWDSPDTIANLLALFVSNNAVLFTNVVIPLDWGDENICILNGDDYEISSDGFVQITGYGSFA